MFSRLPRTRRGNFHERFSFHNIFFAWSHRGNKNLGNIVFVRLCGWYTIGKIATKCFTKSSENHLFHCPRKGTKFLIWNITVKRSIDLSFNKIKIHPNIQILNEISIFFSKNTLCKQFVQLLLTNYSNNRVYFHEIYTLDQNLHHCISSYSNFRNTITVQRNFFKLKQITKSRGFPDRKQSSSLPMNYNATSEGASVTTVSWPRFLRRFENNELGKE